MSHTPGPWVLNPTMALVDSSQRYDDGTPVAICGLLWPTGARSEAETRANGRLIAAAPDLLAACKAARDLLKGTFPAVRLIADLDAAIAKAEGGAR